ncbi:Fur family transcriptional regulator [Leucobacter sp. wl10]|uniref:Fur family transcriptional regulator n=1 Tax=Leucobacter sp. wl10 TaxID=2304677 RepID=UPI000E5AA500|nr:transcriptional repressor [Leucobacter sp. wl10]RGE20675.1 transcriptional repressor [Leucobacter sp. wl10]
MSARAPASSEHWSSLLHARGLRVTEGRLSVLGHIDAHPHSSASAIHAALAERRPPLSPQSVHNIVNDLTEHGLLRRIDPPDSDSALYETRLHDNHHHVQCIVCHCIEDVDCAVGAAPCILPPQTHSMRIIEATVTFRGICTACDCPDAHGSHGAATGPEATPTAAGSRSATCSPPSTRDLHHARTPPKKGISID